MSTIGLPSNKGFLARGLNLPMYVATAWLLGTYATFLLIGQVSAVRDLWGLSLYVVGAAAFFWAGYWLSARRYVRCKVDPPESPADVRQIIRITRLSAVYLGLYGLAMLRAYGATGLGDIMSALLNPGSAYLSKFDIYQQQQTEASNPLIQVLTLAAVLYVPLVPLAVIYWRRLTIAVQLLALLGVAVYVSFYLYIGTTKGLGDLAIFVLAGILVIAARRRAAGGHLFSRRVAGVLALLAATFSGYMAYNQADRIATVGISARFAPNPVVEAVAGENIARGMAVVAFYPTHGYLGLSYNLDTPFEWSEMRGASRAVDSYLAQYGFGDSMSDTSYPVRTQVRTGWPADTYWATAYPWLASDLTFPGVLFVMALLGWWFCRLWAEAVFQRSIWALFLFAQLLLFIAYIPANNQIGISRPATIGFLTSIALYTINRRKYRRARAVPSRKASRPRTPSADAPGGTRSEGASLQGHRTNVRREESA